MYKQSSIESLRSQTAQYMRNHRDEFWPFLVKEDTGDLYSPGTVEVILCAVLGV